MKLKEYIEWLKEVLKEYWDIDCLYASDDEGNSYSSVIFDRTVMLANKKEIKEGGNYIESVEDYKAWDIYPKSKTLIVVVN
jgi:hypothetical protein